MFSGSLVLLYLKTEEAWHVVGGMRATKFIISNQLIDASASSSATPWRELLDKSGLKQLTITCAGAFTGSLAENEVQKLAFASKMADYKLTYPTGNSISGTFQISNYQRIANVNEEEIYSITLTSSGMVNFVG